LNNQLILTEVVAGFENDLVMAWSAFYNVTDDLRRIYVLTGYSEPSRHENVRRNGINALLNTLAFSREFYGGKYATSHN
jgi:hypothetical protein